MPFTKLVLAGTTGFVADHALPAILSSSDPKFEVTVLTRKNSGKTPPSLPGAKLIEVDYNDHASLVNAVSGADAIVSFISAVANKAVDRQLLAAAQEAGVRRIFPSEYTLDVLHPAAVPHLTLDGALPDAISTVPIAREFTELANKGGPTSFTTLVTSGFVDGWLAGSFALFEPKNHKTALVDGGDLPFTGSSLPFIGACLVAVLRMDEEKTKNKRIHVAEVRATMNEVAGLYEKLTGVEFEKTPVSSADMIAERDRLFAAGETFMAYLYSVQIAAFNGCGAGDLPDGLDFDGDGFLTVKRKSLEELVREALKKAGVA